MYGSNTSIARVSKMIAASQQPGDTPEGFFALYRAFLERRAGQWKEARHHADHARKLLMGSGYMLHAAMCHEAAGRFSLAAAEYAELGDIADARLAKRRRGPRGRPASDQLSPMQREIVFLVQEGGTIAQIAKRIARSPRTIAHHLAAVYDKLNIKGKSELLHYEMGVSE
jgi:DNA-binding CsgD family transcriptional regulator